jgi:hypothetical protein
MNPRIGYERGRDARSGLITPVRMAGGASFRRKVRSKPVQPPRASNFPRDRCGASGYAIKALDCYHTNFGG